MTSVSLPAIWLIVLIVGLPQLSETVYTPSLPDIARDLQTSASLVEQTLTLYLAGFAAGTLFWGKLSDSYGRVPCVLAGLAVFILGCVACYFSDSIELLMLSRFVQAFGGSTGSVLGQAICRDAFHGPALGKVYSSTGSALAIFPAAGPIAGGLIAEYAGWSGIFLFLMLFALILSVCVALYLPETHHKNNSNPVSILKIAAHLFRDRKVAGLGFIVAAANGIAFSYFAEGSFYLITLLGLSPRDYGISFVAIAGAAMAGGMLSRKLHDSRTSATIMHYGLVMIVISTTLGSFFVIMHSFMLPLSNSVIIALTLLCQMGTMSGISMATSNALAMALVDYQWCQGSASSLFGFFYYLLIALFTSGMGMLHDGTLLPMPLYFLFMGVFMLIVQKIMIAR